MMCPTESDGAGSCSPQILRGLLALAICLLIFKNALWPA